MKTYDKTQVNEIAKGIKSGKVVALPTETVFGLAVLADDIDATDRLDQLKQRKEGKIYSLMLGSVNNICKFAIISETAKRLIEKYLPGELTIVLPKNPDYINEYFIDSSTIGIRVPDDGFLKKLIEMTGPIIMTSANISGKEASLNSSEVKKKIPMVDVVVDGEAGGRLPTTVVKIVGDEIITLRKGALLVTE